MIDLYSIDAAINGWGPIVPFAQFLGVLDSKPSLPALDQKLGVRGLNEQWLLPGLCKQLTSPPGGGAQNGVNNRPLLLWGYANVLMYGCMVRRLEQENLIQAESEDVPNVVFNARST